MHLHETKQEDITFSTRLTKKIPQVLVLIALVSGSYISAGNPDVPSVSPGALLVLVVSCDEGPPTYSG